MLDASKTSLNGWAWWQDSQHSKALRVHGTSPVAPTSGLAFYAPDFALQNPEPWLVGEACEWQPPEQKSLPDLVHRVSPSGAQFHRLHEQILQRIHRGELEKVVPIVCEELEFEWPLSASMFQALQRPVPEHQMLYGFEHRSEGMVGVTPELLFSVEDGVLQTMALAGTGPVGGPPLLGDPKEEHEHDVVIACLLAELKLLGEVQIGETCERSYGMLKHLYTPLRVNLKKSVHFMQLVSRLHPTPALGGWPRRSALRWLEEQKFHTTRRRFGAPFGYIQYAENSPSRVEAMRCLVAIRNIQWRGDRAQVVTGCGVVKESRVHREWDELQLKRRSLLKNLGVELMGDLGGLNSGPELEI